MLILNYDMSAGYHYSYFGHVNLALKISNFMCLSTRKMSKKKHDSFQLCELCARQVYSRQLADHRAVCGAD